MSEDGLQEKPGSTKTQIQSTRFRVQSTDHYTMEL